MASDASKTPKSLESRLLSKFLSTVAATPQNRLLRISELLTVVPTKTNKCQQVGSIS